MSEGQTRKKQQSLAEKELQREIPKQCGKDDFGWLKCDTDSRKTSAIFASQEQMIKTRARKKIRGLVDDDKWAMWGAQKNSSTPFCLDARSWQNQSMSNDTTL